MEAEEAELIGGDGRHPDLGLLYAYCRPAPVPRMFSSPLSTVYRRLRKASPLARSSLSSVNTAPLEELPPTPPKTPDQAADLEEPGNQCTPTCTTTPPLPRCWCCWETCTEDSSMLRVCGGCKDPDLQWVHRSCMDRFVMQQLRAWLPSVDSALQNAAVPYLTEDIVRWAAHLPPMEVELAAVQESIEMEPFESREEPQVLGRPSLFAQCFPLLHRVLMEALLRSPQPELYRLDTLQMACSRCLDPYVVVAQRVHPFRALFHDRLMFVLFVFKTICISVMFVSCSILLFSGMSLDRSGQALRLDRWYIPEGMNVRQWALMMMLVFGALYAGALWFVLRQFVGYFSIQVKEHPKWALSTSAPMESSSASPHPLMHQHPLQHPYPQQEEGYLPIPAQQEPLQ